MATRNSTTTNKEFLRNKEMALGCICCYYVRSLWKYIRIHIYIYIILIHAYGCIYVGKPPSLLNLLEQNTSLA